MPDTALLPRRAVDRHTHTLGTDRAYFSNDPERTYRYALTRTWGNGERIVWIMLNPSSADCFTDDPTIRRCRSFTRRLVPEAGGLAVVNLYGLRATNPADLWTSEDPIGPDNDYFIGSRATRAQTVIAAWGVHGARNGRATQVATLLAEVGVQLMCLGVTKGGHPKHPLYVPGDTPLVQYEQAVNADA